MTRSNNTMKKLQEINAWAVVCHPSIKLPPYIGDADCALLFGVGCGFTEALGIFENYQRARSHLIRSKRNGVKVRQELVKVKIIPY